ncbi:Endoplasmic reticulum chaperone BiP [Blomia tropicalis]|nr:Endoplasmic reticulum chaperone BiP [Blomia tropicalis]
MKHILCILWVTYAIIPKSTLLVSCQNNGQNDNHQQNENENDDVQFRKDLRLRFKARKDLETYSYKLLDWVDTNRKQLSLHDQTIVDNAMKDLNDWYIMIGINLHVTVKDYQERRLQIDSIIIPIMDKLNNTNIQDDDDGIVRDEF